MSKYKCLLVALHQNTQILIFIFRNLFECELLNTIIRRKEFSIKLLKSRSFVCYRFHEIITINFWGNQPL